MSGINKITAERNQRTLMELVMQPGNGAHHLQLEMACDTDAQYRRLCGLQVAESPLGVAQSRHLYLVRRINLDRREGCSLSGCVQRPLREHPPQDGHTYFQGVGMVATGSRSSLITFSFAGRA